MENKKSIEKPVVSEATEQKPTDMGPDEITIYFGVALLLFILALVAY